MDCATRTWSGMLRFPRGSTTSWRQKNNPSDLAHEARDFEAIQGIARSLALRIRRLAFEAQQRPRQNADGSGDAHDLPDIVLHVAVRRLRHPFGLLHHVSARALQISLCAA